MELEVLNISGKKTGSKVTLDELVFGIEPNDHVIYLDAKQYLASQRQGTHKAKERSEITGSTRKIKKQKGTGTARAGSIKSPVFRGGGRVFGPKPRNYGFKLNQKVKELARKSALSYKAKADSIIVLDKFDLESPKTKDFIAALGAMGVSDTKTLFVTGSKNSNLLLSSRNIKSSNVVTVDELNTYGIVNASKLVLLEDAVSAIEEKLK